MKTKISRICLIGFIFISSVFSSVLQAESPNPKTYTNSKYGFKVGYPSDWDIREKHMNTRAILITELPIHVDISAVRVSPATNSYLKNAKDATIQELKGVFDNFSLITDQRITLAGRNAYRIVFAYRIAFPGIIDKCQMQSQKIFTVKEGIIYSITYTAQQKAYFKYLPFFNQIVSSFSFIK